jgi:hypothetical protein
MEKGTKQPPPYTLENVAPQVLDSPTLACTCLAQRLGTTLTLDINM